MSDTPYIKLFAADFLADTAHLRAEAEGVYIRLLLMMWCRGGRLPNDIETLARMGGITVRRWTVLAPVLLPFFDIDADGLTQKRLTKERRNVDEIRSSRVASGRRGGQANALRYKKLGEANASILLNQKGKQKGSILESNKSLESSSVSASLTRTRTEPLRLVEGGAGAAQAAPATGGPSQPGLVDFTDPEDILP